MFIETEKLSDYAANTARLMKTEGEAGGHRAAAAVRRAYLGIKRCHGEISRRFASLPTPPSGCEWIMDNFYMISREYSCIYPQLLSAKHLRYCDEGLLVHALCETLVRCSENEVTEERFSVFVEYFKNSGYEGKGTAYRPLQ